MCKSYCSVHHLYYSGTQCSMCLQERSQKLAEKHYKEKKKQEETVTDDMLNALVNKFK